MPRWFPKFLLITLVISPIAALSTQKETSEHVFAPIPETVRDKLINRLKLLVEHERNEQWDKEYDLLSKSVTQNETKKDFVARLRNVHARRSRYKLMKFTPKYTTLLHEHRWEVFGCVEVLHRGRKQQLNGEVAAILERDEWFFSQVSFDREPCTR